MWLTKQEIEHQIATNNISIDPFDSSALKAASYTLKLGSSITLEPGQFVVLESLETIHLPDDILGVLSTRGSIAKLGIDALGTDTIVEPGSSGKLAFCSKNNSDHPVTLEAGNLYVKIVLFKTP
jgi:dCTP deaminase